MVCFTIGHQTYGEKNDIYVPVFIMQKFIFK